MTAFDDLSPYTKEQVAAVAAKLQTFFEALDPDERTILQALLLDACGNPAAARCLLLSACDRPRPPARTRRDGSHSTISSPWLLTQRP